MYPTINDVLDIARQSECVRRKYGTIIVSMKYNAHSSELEYASGYNKRVSKCCDGICVRDRLDIKHGMNTDAGAEVHAEQMALVNKNFDGPAYVYSAGLDRYGNPLIGLENGSCYVCARLLKLAGLDYVFLPFDGMWKAVSVSNIIETWEQQWEEV